MKIPHLSLALLIVFALLPSVTCKIPIFTLRETLYMQKHKSKTEHMRAQNGNKFISGFTLKNINKINQDFGEPQFPLISINNACRCYNLSVVNIIEIKQIITRFKNGMFGGNSFGTRKIVVNKTHKSRGITYNTNSLMMCFFRDFSPLVYTNTKCIDHFSASIFGTGSQGFFALGIALFFSGRKFYSMKYLFEDNNKKKKKKSKKNEFFHFAFVAFFVHSFQTFDNESLTLMISNSSDFEEIQNYANLAKHVHISQGVSSIPAEAFREWDSLISVNIGESVTTIENSSFYGCSSLTTVIIGENVTTIGNYSFCLCSNLQTVHIGENVITIGTSAFVDCTTLTNITIPNSVTLIGNTAFSTCSNLETVIIGESVTTIETSAFYDCSHLVTVIIGESVITIGTSVFMSCTSLKTITIPNSVTVIGNSAFSLCSNLETVFIGKNVTTIEKSAFSRCNKLKCIYFYGESEPNIVENAFNNVSASVITFSTYQGLTFGTFNVTRDATIA